MYELENHMEQLHSIKFQFTCAQCEKGFVSRTRLKMHEKMHDPSFKTRNCHYYNNDVPCPYEKYGCKFSHKRSGECKYKGNCRISKCQFRH